MTPDELDADAKAAARGHTSEVRESEIGNYTEIAVRFRIDKADLDAANADPDKAAVLVAWIVSHVTE